MLRIAEPEPQEHAPPAAIDPADPFPNLAPVVDRPAATLE